MACITMSIETSKIVDVNLPVKSIPSPALGLGSDLFVMPLFSDEKSQLQTHHPNRSSFVSGVGNHHTQ